MDLVSLQYWALVGALLLVYFWLPGRLQNGLLLLASVAFCATWDFRYTAILLGGTCLDYALGRCLAWDRPDATRRAALWASIACNLLVLAGFKYGPLLLAPPAAHVAQPLGAPDLLSAAHPVAALKHFFPIGLSFYSLQRLTHTLDVYFRVLAPSASLLDFALFTSFFPQLLAGPIERARNMLPQLAVRRAFSLPRFYEGCWLIGLGLFKKTFIADNCGALASELFGSAAEPTHGWSVLLGLYAYAFQIYADFGGYSDLARGSARLFGIEIMQNFAAPYLSVNLAEYWQRWHISLSTFLDEYLFRPTSMAVRELGSAGVVLATWVTFLASGLWHGTGLCFLVWGAVHAAGLSVFALTRRVRKQWKKRLPQPLLASLGVLLTFHYVCFGYAFFHAHSLSEALHTLSSIAAIGSVGAQRLGAVRQLPALALYAAAVVGLDLMQRESTQAFWVFRYKTAVRAACYALMLFCVLRLRAPSGHFIYAEF